MFWQKARKIYSNITKEDIDVKKYFEIMDSLQELGYQGIPGYFQDMGHKFVARFTRKGRTVEIGFGRGRQGVFFKGNPDCYYPVEVNQRYIDSSFWNTFKNSVVADARHLPYSGGTFDNAVSIYNLEHIQDIESVVCEIRRVLKSGGKFVVALPCEGGFVWNLGRQLITRKAITDRYKINYDKIIAFEHVHNISTIRKILKREFHIVKERFFPLLIPSIHTNLIYCSVFTKRQGISPT